MNATQRPRRSGQRGFTLIECLILVAMASIVMASISAFQHTAHQRLREQHDQSQALAAAASILDLCRADPGWLAGLPLDNQTVLLPALLPAPVVPPGMTAQALVSALAPPSLRLINVTVTFNSLLGGARTVRLGAVINAQRGAR